MGWDRKKSKFSLIVVGVTAAVVSLSVFSYRYFRPAPPEVVNIGTVPPKPKGQHHSHIPQDIQSVETALKSSDPADQVGAIDTLHQIAEKNPKELATNLP
ncbi:MAG TPA: hypothetical protein VHS31_14730, partial [Tepidisphaeraceae bacterium]|nr:hypothetical protein [Tepidisphaeraceae bacterium]